MLPLHRTALPFVPQQETDGPANWSDVGVLTNVQADHLGQDGLRTVHDVLHVKSLVAERVREGGTLIVNAEDERLARLPGHARIARTSRRIVFFALSPADPAVRSHRAQGGTAYFLRDGRRGLRAGWVAH